MNTALYANNIYGDKMKTPGIHLQRIIQTQAPDISLETIDSITGLSQRLCQPAHKISVTILIVESEEELIGLGSLATLFDDIRVILILWDRQKTLLTWANNLRPSYISYVDSDLNDVILVLKQIQKHRNKQRINDWRR